MVMGVQSENRCVNGDGSMFDQSTAFNPWVEVFFFTLNWIDRRSTCLFWSILSLFDLKWHLPRPGRLARTPRSDASSGRRS